MVSYPWIFAVLLLAALSGLMCPRKRAKARKSTNEENRGNES